MRYSLLLHNNEPAEGELSEEQINKFQAAFDRYAKTLEQAGVLISAEILQPSTATTTLTLRNGQREIRPGPLHNTPENSPAVLLSTRLISTPLCTGPSNAPVLNTASSKSGRWQLCLKRESGSRRCEGSSPSPST